MVAMIPVAANAAVCFKGPGEEITLLEIVGSAGRYFSIVGEHFTAPDNPDQNPQPLSGVAHLRPDGSAHFSYTAVGSVALIYAVTGTLLPPNFNTGSGFESLIIDSTVFSGTPVTFSPATCPVGAQ
jgi:hypothetical protein